MHLRAASCGRFGGVLVGGGSAAGVLASPPPAAKPALNTPSEEASKWLRVPLRPLPHTFSTPPYLCGPQNCAGPQIPKMSCCTFKS